MSFTTITEYNQSQGEYIASEKILINLDKIQHGIYINEEVMGLWFGNKEAILVSRKEFNNEIFPED